MVWLKLFNVRKEESGIVSNFFFHHFFLGLGLALLLLVSETLFISLFPVSYFPMVFICSSIAMMLTGRIYSYFEHKLPFKKLLPIVLLVIIAMTLIIWILFFVKSIIILPIILFIVFRIIYLLSNLEFWGLSSIVFDVRQGKRLFGLISSGDMPAKLLGYLSVYLFVPVFGLPNLLLIAVVAFIISRYFLSKIFLHPEYSQQHAVHTKKHFSDKAILTSFFGNNFIFSLAILGFLTACAISVIEYSFLSKVKTEYHSQEDLAAFLSIFLIIGYSITLIIKLLFSGRISSHVGIKRSLMILPLIVIGISLAFYFLEFRNYSLHDSLMFICILFISTSIFRYSINDPIFLVLFQPLQTQMRLKGHTIIKGFIQPLALGFVGIALFLITYLKGEVDFSYLNLGLIIIGVLWIVAIGYSNKQYLITLGDAIKKRFISGTDLGIVDDNYFNLLKGKLYSEHSNEIVYAISMLEKTNLVLLKTETIVLLDHKNEIVVEYIIDVIERNNWDDFSEKLYQLFLNSSNTKIKTQSIKIFCRLNKDVTIDFLDTINSQNSSIQASMFIGLLEGSSQVAKNFAKGKLHQLCNSENDKNKIIAAEIIGETREESFFELLFRLINEHNVDVQLSAVRAAGNTKSNLFVSKLLDLIHVRELRKDIIFSLSEIKKGVAKEIWKRLENNPNTIKGIDYEYIKILENIGDEEASNVLFKLLPNSTIGIRNVILSSLQFTVFEDTKDRSLLLNDILKDEFHYIYWIFNTISDKRINERIIRSLNYELDCCKDRMFLCLGLLYDKNVVKKAEAALSVASKEKKANALEILDQIVPRKMHDYLVALVDNIPLDEKLSKLKIFVIKDVSSPTVFIIKKGSVWFSNWTIASALNEVELNISTMALVYSFLQNEDLIIQESAKNALRNFQQKNIELFNEFNSALNLNINEIDMMINRNEQRLSEIEKVIVLKSTALFGGTPENIIAEIVAIVTEVLVEKDELIFSKGDSGSSMYIIYEGEVKIHDGDKIFAILGSHNFFGELALLDPEPRSATATATTDTLLLRLSEEDAYELMEERVEVLKSIMKILCKRIRLQNIEITSKSIVK